MPGIVLGRELAKNLGVVQGDVVHLISPRGMLAPTGHVPAMKAFRVSGYFESGITSSIRPLPTSTSMTPSGCCAWRCGDGAGGSGSRYLRGARRGGQHRIAAGQLYYARDWMQMNRNLFKALKLERRVMFHHLDLIVLVAAFNIASSLIMMVMGKTKDIAILKAMGATDAASARSSSSTAW